MFLNIHGMLLAILDYIQELAEAKVFVKNCMQSTLWSTIYRDWKKFVDFSENRITLPLLIYFDEFVVGACLGANVVSTQFGAVYTMLLCLPSLTSKLSSILFSSIRKAKHLSDFGNTKVFSYLVDELNSSRNDGPRIIHNGMGKKFIFNVIWSLGII